MDLSLPFLVSKRKYVEGPSHLSDSTLGLEDLPRGRYPSDPEQHPPGPETVKEGSAVSRLSMVKSRKSPQPLIRLPNNLPESDLEYWVSRLPQQTNVSFGVANPGQN